MKRDKKRLLLSAIGLLVSTVPTLVCVLTYFPVWRERGSDYVISGLALLFSLLAILPLIRIIKQKLKSPSAYLVWLIIFLLFFSLSRIAEEVTVISFVGFVTNLIGSVFFKLAAREKSDNEKT